MLAAVVLLTWTSPTAAAGPYPPGADRPPALALPTPIGDVGYTPGRGLRVGDTRLTLAGYGAVDLVHEEGGPTTLRVESLDLFVIWDPLARVHLFSEIDTIDQEDPHEERRNFLTDRLFGDFAGYDWLNLRVGKFLTPVGRWNQIHARPLVWTTSRPLATELPFDPYVTGAMLFGSRFPRTGTLTYSLYGQFTNNFDVEPPPQAQDRAVGARLEYASLGGWSVGGSYLAFTALPGEREAPERGAAAAGDQGGWRHLTGLDTLWQRGPFELMGEFAFQEPARGPGRQWGLYLQAVEEVVRRVYLIQRYEYYDHPAPEPVVNLGVLGLAYKPWPFVVLKGEYLFADRRAEESPPGVKSSFTILF
ncbi:MAG: hypothetical protein E6J55_18190 [Deltaproteobacteria bacterium]|nr:MAG: hypothetical protein E6J55_18190 [Deltaproteobacteria bacterium]